MRRVRLGIALGTVLAAALLFSTTLRAQGLVVGRATDDSTGVPLAKVPARLVRLVGRARIEVASIRLGDDGAFAFRTDGPGTYRVEVGTAVRTVAGAPPDSVAGGDTVHRELALPFVRGTVVHPLEQTEVDLEAMWEPNGPRPIYPPNFKYRHLAGDATASFVVAPDGRIMPGSVTITDASDPEFAQAMREWLARPDLRYRVARVGSVAVAQHVIQPMHFSVPK